MKLTLAALFAVALAAGATPAAACGAFVCYDEALASDSYPPAIIPLPPDVQAQVEAREGRGLSLAGFYNDPAVSVERREYAPPVYVAAPGPDYVEAPAPWVEDGFYHHRRGPHVIVSPYGRRMAHERYHERHRVY